MWSAALGTPSKYNFNITLLAPISMHYFRKIFNQMANGKAFFDQDDFKRVMKQNPDTLAWFTKPEKAMK
jgi:hypothetical protein